MKKQIIKIAQDLEQGAITIKTAQTLLLGLFGVSVCCYCNDCQKTLTGDGHNPNELHLCIDCSNER